MKRYTAADLTRLQADATRADAAIVQTRAAAAGFPTYAGSDEYARAVLTHKAAWGRLLAAEQSIACAGLQSSFDTNTAAAVQPSLF